jgi:hypothetical protein
VTDLALDIPDQQLHLVGLFIIAIRTTRQAVRDRDRAIRHAHVEAVRHAATAAKDAPPVFALDRRCAGNRRVGGGHVELGRERAGEVALVSSLSFAVDQRKVEIQTVGQGGSSDGQRQLDVYLPLHLDSPLGTSRIGTDDNTFFPAGNFGLNVRNHGQLGEQVVTRDVKETLDLGSVKVHGDDVIRSSDGQEVGNQPGKKENGRTVRPESIVWRRWNSLGSDRCSSLVLLVLSGIRITRDNGCNPFCGSRFTSCFIPSVTIHVPQKLKRTTDQDQQLHQVVIDTRRTWALQDEAVLVSDRLVDLHASLARREF